MNTPQKVTYDPTPDFYQALRARVDRYFRMTKRSPHDSWKMYLKTAIIIVFYATCYSLLVFWATTWLEAILLSIGLGIGIAAVGFNIQHDGGHEAYSKHKWINRAMAFTMDLMGASSYVWARKHNVLHHTYTNLAGHDDDIDLGPLARFSPEQPRLWHHRLQQYYMWVLYAVIVPKWSFRDDFHNLLRGRIGEHKLPRPKGWDLLQFFLGKLAWLTLILLVPLMFHPFLAILACYFIAAGTAGIILSIVFQLAHVVEETHFPVPHPETGRVDTPWAIHEVQTTADFAQKNKLLSWYVGGLNFQIEHHLFPRICHVHYPKIARIVENACRRHGIRYTAFPTVGSAVRSHYRWLRELGSPKPAAS